MNEITLKERIAKAVYENHSGRKWEDASPGTFAAYLKLAQYDLDAIEQSDMAIIAAAPTEAIVSKMVKAHYESYFCDVAELEPAWDEYPESHKDRMRKAMYAAITTLFEEAANAPLETNFLGMKAHKVRE